MSQLDPQQERISAIKAAADIICEDIRSQVYDNTTYSPSTDFLKDVYSVIHWTFMETLILK